MRLRGSSLLAIVLGCAGEPSMPAATPSRAPEPIEPQPAKVDPAFERLTSLAVHHDDFARAELYTWTTSAQLEQLRATRCLLQADGNTSPPSAFHRALVVVPRDGSAIAGIAALLVEHEALARRRYAWPNPFATTLGLGPRRYGDVLVRIELDARSFLARFEPAADPPLTFVDMQGERVTPGQVLAEPLRLAAVYHVGAGSPDQPAYREYVVVSEAMITAWSVATPAIAERLADEIELLDALATTTLAQLPRAAVERPAALDWATRADPTPLAGWHASLAFDTPRYRPTVAGLHRIAAALGEGHPGAPLIHHPQSEPCRR